MKKTLYISLGIFLILIGLFFYVFFQKMETQDFVKQELNIPEEILINKLQDFDAFRENWSTSSKTDSTKIFLKSNRSSYSSIQLLQTQNEFPDRLHFKNWLSDQFIDIKWTLTENSDALSSVSLQISTQVDFFDKLNKIINKETALEIAHQHLEKGLETLEKKTRQEMQAYDITQLEDKKLSGGFLLKSSLLKASDLNSAIHHSKTVLEKLHQTDNPINLPLDCILINSISADEVLYQVGQLFLIQPELSHELIDADYKITRLEKAKYTRHRLLGNVSNIDKLWYQSFEDLNVKSADKSDDMPIIYMLSKDNNQEINPAKWYSELWIPFVD
ncbi:MAG: hypothetical protein L0J45_04655 [Psychroflexus sp.]|nr:hypothetical protein [Psychroflexus sp.]